MQRLWIGNQPDPIDRVQIEVSELDYARVQNATKPFELRVFDHITERSVFIADEDCGCGCRCALRFV